MAVICDRIKREIAKIDMEKGFFRFDGEKYISRTFDGEYGRTYFVMYEVPYEYNDKEKGDCVDAFLNELFGVFDGNSMIAWKDDGNCGAHAKLHLNGKPFVVRIGFDEAMELEWIGATNEDGKRGDMPFESFHQLVDHLRKNAGIPLGKPWKSKFDNAYGDWDDRKRWRCDIMIPDDAWGNTCTTKYGDSFTEAFENARSCRAGLGA